MPDLHVLLRLARRAHCELLSGAERMRADPELLRHFPKRAAPLGDLRNRESLELVAKVAAAHLASHQN